MVVQGVTRPMFISAAVGTALMPLYLWLFILKLQWGVSGAACAYSAAIISIAAVNVLVVVWRETSLRRAGDPARCFHGWTWAAFGKIRGYLHYALPSYVMYVLLQPHIDVLCTPCTPPGCRQSGGSLSCAWC